MAARLRPHAASATAGSLGVILALAVVAVVTLSGAPTASAGPSHPEHSDKVKGTWSDPVGACVAHIISFDPSTGDFVCTGTSEWTGAWTGSTTWTLTGNQSPTGAVSGRIDEVFTGHVADGSTGTLSFGEHITIDPAGNTDIRGSIVDSSGGLAHSRGHARWIGISNADGSGSGTYFGDWHQGQPKCGDTITTDVTLHKDLINCPNNGIIIGADNITLDLNYHTVDGDGSLTPGCNFETEFCDEGVVNLGHDGVTVVHGSVREFAFGADAGRVRHVRFLDISASRNLFFGMVIFASARSVIRNGSSTRNIPPDGDGIGVFGSNHVRIVHNKIRRNPGPGIHVDDSNQNLIKRNMFSRNGPGILLAGDRNEVRRNRLSRGGGILVGPASHNVIARNRVSRALDSIAIETGRGNLVTRNVVVRARGGGIRLGLQNPLIGGARNIVRRNQVKRSVDDGFLVNEKDNHSLLKGNKAKGAGDDGFDVRSRSAKLTGNRALRNGDLGIEAVRGVNDGGGNIARRNGDPRQCTHVVCR